MKFTIWERNNIYTLIGSLKFANVRHLEIIQSLREKFTIEGEEEWEKYSRLSALHDRQISEEQREFLKDYGEKIHRQEENIKLTKAELKYIANSIMNDNINLPVQPQIIDKSIDFVKKIQRKKQEAEEI